MIDYMVMEAVALKMRKQEAEAEKNAQRKQLVEEQKQRLKEKFR